jgi:glycosyltransferase involved in cell wall biosynthesis
MYKVKDVCKKYKDSRIRVYRNSVNLGLTKSLNLGIKQAKGDIIARMDGDDISEKGRFRTQFKFLRDNPECSLVGSSVLIIDDKGNVIRKKRRLHSYKGVKFYCSQNNPFMHSSVMFYKDCFLDVGGYDEHYRYAQDYELWTRFLHKYNGININEFLLRWRSNSKGISNTKQSAQSKYADDIVIKWFRREFPGLFEIPDKVIVDMRRTNYTRYNKGYLDIVAKRMLKKFNCSYFRSWYSDYLTQTNKFR